MAPLQQPSDIQKFYEKSSIFITGGSGFLGHLLIQKLIRDCPDLSKMYLMIRPKKGKSLEERFEVMLENPVFERMKKECPNYKDKIQLISGDLEKPDMGISEEDKIFLSKEVNIIFHLAATLRFNEKIGIATALNVGGTRDVLNLARTMPNLKAFVHCSTAYSNCVRKDIDEVFYDMPDSPDRLLRISEVLNDKELDVLTSELIRDYPNTYVFTKGLAENLIRDEGQGLPITIFRPSMVISTVDDPLEGWINNIYGPVGFTCGVALGVIRVVYADVKRVGDTVPGDYVINNMIAASYYIGTTFKTNSEKNFDHPNEIALSNNIPIFNCVSGIENLLTWGLLMNADFVSKAVEKWAPLKAIWYHYTILESNLYLYKFYELCLHTIPAYVMDFILFTKGKKRRMVKIYQKISAFSEALSYFAMREWNFKNNNTQALWKNMNSTDKKIFPFSFKEMDWETYYLDKYPKGIRQYILKDPLETLPRALKRYKKLKYLHYTVVCILCIIFAVILLQILKFSFK